MTTTKFDITLTENGKHSKVIFDDEDVSNKIDAVSIQSAVGEVTIVTARHVVGAGRVKGEGIIVVLPGEQAATLIEALDAAEIEQEALKRLEWGDGATLTANVLRVILERLRDADQP